MKLKSNHTNSTSSFSLRKTIPRITQVTGIKINNTPAFIQNATGKPDDPGFANWNYSGSSLTIETAHFDVIDSIRISFSQLIPYPDIINTLTILKSKNAQHFYEFENVSFSKILKPLFVYYF